MNELRVAGAVLLGLLLLWVMRKRYKKSPEASVDAVSEDDVDADPHRRKRPWQ